MDYECKLLEWTMIWNSSYTNRLISAKDHGSIQINVGNVDPTTGLFTGESTTFALAGYIRNKSEGDMALTSLVEKSDAESAAAASDE